MAGLLALFVGLALASLRQESPTVDEFAHLPAGYYYLKTGDFSLYSKNPPLIKMIAALPWLILKPAYEPGIFQYPTDLRPWRYGAAFMRLNQARYPELFFWGRIPIVILAVLLGLLVWSWSRRLYGPAGGIISLFCFCLCPNFLAHSGLATVDVGASLFFGLAVWAGLHLVERVTFPRAALAGFLLGLAQLSKFTALLLLPLFLLLPLAAAKRHRRRLGLLLPVLLLVAWLVLLAGYRFEWDPGAFGGMRFRSQLFQTGQRLVSAIPLPPDYLAGLDAQLHDSEQSPVPNYLFGHWYRGNKWYYLPVALAVKVPIPLWLAWLAALFLTRGTSARPRRFSPEEIGLLAVILLFLGAALPSQLQIGVRYLLPIFPLAYVLIGRLGTLGSPLRHSRWRLLALALFGLWLLVGTIRIFPHYLAYFNELAGGPDRGYKILLDSNLDWGQDLPGLAEYMRTLRVDKVNLAYFGPVDPEVYGIHYSNLQTDRPSGLTAVSVSLLMGFPNPWTEIPLDITTAFQQRKPLAKIGYSIFLFRDNHP